MSDGPVLLFDGVCMLCDRSVQFVIDHEPDGQIRFASLHSKVGQSLLAAHGLDTDAVDSVVLVENGRALVRSDAALATASRLAPPWCWLTAARVVPRGIRDSVYDWVARNRKRWFGTRDACRIPTPALQSRFLDADGQAPSPTAS